MFRAAVNDLPKGGSGTLRVGPNTIRFAAKAVRAEGGSAPGAYVVAAFVDDERRELAEAVRSYLLVALVALMAVGLGAWSVSGRLLRPLRELRETADRIGHSDLTRRIESTGHDDISDLARTFNAMLDRLEDAFAGQRRFLDDAGHELRTPLTIVRGHLELLVPGDLDDVATTRALVLDELDRMGRLVDDLVVLARAGRPDFLRTTTVDLGSLTDDVLDKARGLGDRSWRCDARAEAAIDADPQRLTQALLQLAANAVAHTEPGAVVAVDSATSEDRVSLWVRDEGCGVPPGDAARIFDRFQRGEGADLHGAGLGLSIVRAIATAHDGTVHLVPDPRPGALFRIDLPGAPARIPVEA
ncbi:MAG: sensor histidine kinase [Sporichthyaceae bacterium]